MNEIEKFVTEGNYSEAVQECVRANYNHFGILLSHVTSCPSELAVKQLQSNISGIKTEGKIIQESIDNTNSTEENPSLISDDEKDQDSFPIPEQPKKPTESKTRVKLLCNWMPSAQLREWWNKMSQGNYTWNNIQVVLDDDPDYFVVINSPPRGVHTNPKKTIIFRMEPYMGDKNKAIWGEWANPDPEKFFKICFHKNEYNNNCWEINKTYQELKTMPIVKTESVLSTVLSPKYFDPGHVKRIDFVKFLEKKGLPVHVFGSNKWGYKDYKGPLPQYEKDNAMFPYKYVFNCENNSIKNYYTEKLIDGILAECLVFYSGCYNVRDYIDERAFVYLELSNFEEDYKKVRDAIDNNLWEERLPYIQEAKKKILEYLQFFPRLERIINKTEDEKYDSSKYES